MYATWSFQMPTFVDGSAASDCLVVRVMRFENKHMDPERPQ